jgi:hypothetical protein
VYLRVVFGSWGCGPVGLEPCSTGPHSLQSYGFDNQPSYLGFATMLRTIATVLAFATVSAASACQPVASVAIQSFQPAYMQAVAPVAIQSVPMAYAQPVQALAVQTYAQPVQVQAVAPSYAMAKVHAVGVKRQRSVNVTRQVVRSR